MGSHRKSRVDFSCTLLSSWTAPSFLSSCCNTATCWPEDDNHEQSADVRAQLKLFEQLDQMENQQKEEQEWEILLKAG